MTNVTAADNFVSNLNPLHAYGSEHVENKWTYLIATNIKYANKLIGKIRIKKPDEQQMFAWMERIVVGGQCSVLFVESLDVDDIRTHRIKALCEFHNVTLVNLTLDTHTAENVVFGPWH